MSKPIKIGRKQGFSQRHYKYTDSHYCPKEAVLRTEGLIRSPVTIEDIEEDILKFGLLNSERPSEDLFNEVVRDATLAFELPSKVNPIHLNDLPSYHQKTDSSSPGLPWKERGYITKRQVLDDEKAFTSIRKFWHKIKYEERDMRPPDCCAFVRPHLVQAGEKKCRCIWGYPATIGFQEACFAVPLIESYIKHDSQMAYGYETMLGGHLRILNRFGSTGNFLSSDFKSFDKYVPAWLMRIAFDILLRNIDFRKYREKGVPSAPHLYKAWKYIVDYFINTPIRLANGTRYRKRSGVASGSYFTQLIDSICNWIVLLHSFCLASLFFSLHCLALISRYLAPIF